jgi:hypothetical protein
MTSAAFAAAFLSFSGDLLLNMSTSVFAGMQCRKGQQRAAAASRGLCCHGQARDPRPWLHAERRRRVATEREILTASTATLAAKAAPQNKRRLPARSKITKTLARAS